MNLQKSKLLLFFLIVCVSMTSFSQTLIVTFNDGNAEPYAFVADGKLTGGILYDLGEALGRELGVNMEYKDVPRARHDSYLLDGKTHISLVFNPYWTNNADALDWSEGLFEELNIFMLSSSKVFPINSFDDLSSLKVGTIRGYFYPGMMELFESGTIIRADVASLTQNFLILKANRIDTLIDSDILINYYLRENNAFHLYEKADMVASSHFMHSAISRKSPIPTERIIEALHHLRDSGEIEEIVSSYQ